MAAFIGDSSRKRVDRIARQARPAGRRASVVPATRLRGATDEPQQAITEDRGAKRKRFSQSSGGACGLRVLPPGLDVIFRPEEVQGVSEPLARFRAHGIAPADPR